MAGATGPEQVVGGVQCFDKRICRYFNEDGLSKFAFSSWPTMLGTSARGGAEGELSLDAKLKLLKSNLTKFEKSLRDGRVSHIPEFLRSNGLQHPLVHPEVVTAVCSYLLYLVSCHSDPVMVNSAANALSYHIENGAAFTPDRAQILAIALNMGMKEEYLPGFSRDELPRYVREEGGGATSRAGLDKYPDPFNVQQLIGCLTELLRPGRHWTDTARDTLFSVLVAILVDPYMEQMMMSSRVTICLDRLLQGYERASWGSSGSDSCKLLDLVEQLGSLPAGGRLPVLAGLPPLGRGLQLRHLTGYLYLQHTIHDQHPGCTDSHGEPVFFDLPPIVTVGGALSIVRGHQVGGLPAAVFASKTSQQLRSCYTVLRCVDAVVGSEPLPSSQVEDLRQLKELLNTEIDRVSYVADHTLELRTHLKEFMTILHSKWSGMCKRQN